MTLYTCTCLCGCQKLTTQGVGNALDPAEPMEPLCDDCWEGDDCDGITPRVAEGLANIDPDQAIPAGVTASGAAVEMSPQAAAELAASGLSIEEVFAALDAATEEGP